MHTIRKFDGDDRLSWAVFKKRDLPKGRKGVIFHGEARPIVSGLGRSEAEFYKKKFDLERAA